MWVYHGCDGTTDNQRMAVNVRADQCKSATPSCTLAQAHVQLLEDMLYTYESLGMGRGVKQPV